MGVTAVGVGGPEVVLAEQVKACLPLFRDGVSQKAGGKVNKGRNRWDFFKVGVPQGRVSRLFDLITLDGHC